MIDPKTLQMFLKAGGYYLGAVDGIWGPASIGAARTALKVAKAPVGQWDNSRVLIAINQLFLNKTNDARLVVDGVAGQRTNDALYIYSTIQLRGVTKFWPRQAEVRSGKSIFGEPGENLVKVTLPFTMYGDYEKKIVVKSTTVHKLLGPSIVRILTRTLEHYGEEQIKKLRLDIFSGCYNYRRTAGGGALSMHAWAAAWDSDAAHNQFNEDSSEAAFAKPVYAPFLDFWEEEGWVSLGRARNYDWMHLQAARLG